MIFYFTATGNSLYAAKQLDTELISIPQAIHSPGHHYQADQIGIVCPVFGHEVPPIVREFLHSATFETDYFYMILTYGARHGGAAELAKKLTDDLGIRASYINTLLMKDNFLPRFDMDEQRMLDKHEDQQIKAILADIQIRKQYIQPATDVDHAAHQEFLARSTQPPEARWKNLFWVTDDCIGCGICTRVCPEKCWHIGHEKAVYDTTKCQACLACIQHCPQRAIQFTMPEKNPNARYRNEHISLAEIIAANKQV